MPLIEAKVYYDGSHYIAIPYHEPQHKRKKKTAEQVENEEAEQEIKVVETPKTEPKSSELNLVSAEELQATFEDIDVSAYIQEDKKTIREIFEEVYKDSIECSNRERKERLMNALRPVIMDDEFCKAFVEDNLQRIRKNAIKKKVRVIRKINLQNFNYFVTFTYDDKLLDEVAFRKKLKRFLSNASSRRGWKYIGVFERSPEKHRLHFHGIFVIPKGTIPGELKEVRDYDTRNHRMQTSYQSDYFTKRFGRADFKEITSDEIYSSVSYILKYIEKSGERLMYSKGLPQYFISDVLDEDIVCPYDEYEHKYVLSDHFTCYDYGEDMGQVSPEVIEKMRKSN